MEKLMDCTTSRCRSALAGLGVIALSACSGSRSAPVASPTPGTEGNRVRPLEVPTREGFERAVTNGTRTRTGAPGPRYWQQWSEYKLEAELNPISKRLAGHGTIKYFNRSPDTLSSVYIHLLHNIFAPGARHDTN